MAATSTVSVSLSHAFHPDLMEVVLVHWRERTVGTFNLGVSGLLWVNVHIFLKSPRPL